VTPADSSPSLVTDDEITALLYQPGGAGAIIDGLPTDANVQRLDAEGFDVTPEERTPEPISAIQTAARALGQAFEAIAGSPSVVEVVDTPTGAAIVGLIGVSGTAGSTSVPVENVLLVTAGGTALLLAGADGPGNVVALAGDGSVVLQAGGSLAVALRGLPAGSSGENVLTTTGSVVSKFDVAADGSSDVVVAHPGSLESGAHTLVFAAGTARIAVGISTTALSTELPQTGRGLPITAPLLILVLGAVTALVTRCRREA